jgi:hypothetical protein
VTRIAVALTCLGLAVAVQIGRDRAYPRNDPDTQQLLYVRSPEVLKRIALGFDALAADVYWIRAIQHYGGDRLNPGRARRYELLYPLLDITTSLDPYFNIPYRFGAIFLAEPYPGGPGRPDQAIALLRKGLAVQPAKWQYYHDIAFVHYWALRDPVAAATWFRRAGEQPGAPNWLMPVAAAMLTQGSDRTSARFLWQQMLAADQEWLRRRARHALQQLGALDQIDQLTAIVSQTPKPEGEPYTWAWLARARGFRGVPPDPSGTPYEIDPATGQVSVSKSSALFPLPKPVEPRR